MKNLLAKVKRFSKTKAGRLVTVGAVVSTAALTMAMGVSADTTTIDTTAVTTALTTGLSSAVTQTVSVMSAVIPYGLTIYVMMFIVHKGKAFFATTASSKG